MSDFWFHVDTKLSTYLSNSKYQIQSILHWH
jgi:hypothetical protein